MNVRPLVVRVLRNPACGVSFPAMRRCLLLAGLLLVSLPLRGQSGSTAAAVTGASLGGAATAVLGATGALAPCALTRAPATCVRTFALFTAAAGITAGAVLGARNSDAVTARWNDAAWGGAIGAAVGVALMPMLRAWSPRDAVALSLLGGAIGSAPLGAVIGLGAGLVVGALRQGLDEDGTPFGVLAHGIAGLAAGALAEWVLRAAEDPQAPIGVTVRVTLP